MARIEARRLGLGALALSLLAAPATGGETRESTPAPVEQISLSVGTVEKLDGIFEKYRVSANAAGLVYGVVIDDRLVLVRSFGVQDVTTRAPVTAETVFRIASMTKAFTALAVLDLRDQGKLSLDQPASAYVPELRGWRYPTTDARPIRVRDLLNHLAGFVGDNPWGDRQQSIGEGDFSKLLEGGTPFARSPGTVMEYSNLGYAILGRVIANVSGESYRDHINRVFLEPLGMRATTFYISKIPNARRALGYRWNADHWQRELDMAQGAFDPVGGIQTSARDYARWVAYLLSGWPPRDGAERGPVRRASVREIGDGSNHLSIRPRPGLAGGAPCRMPTAYGMGWNAIEDCELGGTLVHTGGYPGFGSAVLLLPGRRAGVFAFTNATYAAPYLPMFEAALALDHAGTLPVEPVLASPSLAQAYEVVRSIWRDGSVDAVRDHLSGNFLLDRDAATWRKQLAELKLAAGPCDVGEAVVPTSVLAGRFSWKCNQGHIFGVFSLAPVRQAQLQSLALARSTS